jgi:transcriptional regulator with XRE-family HTH domain
MRPERLTQWREARGLSKAAACRLLGVGSVNTWDRYESGERRIPLSIRLAITALQHNLPPYE